MDKPNSRSAAGKGKRKLPRALRGRPLYHELSPPPLAIPMAPAIPYKIPSSRSKSKSSKSASKKSNSTFSDSDYFSKLNYLYACRSGESAEVAPGPQTEGLAPFDANVKPVRYPVADQRRATKTPAQGLRFARIYTEQWRFVRRTIERYGVPSRDAPDVAQEVFTVALRRLEEFDISGSPRPWLWVIAMQLVANYKNLARHRVEPLSDTDPPEPASEAIDVESALVASEEQRLARELIGRLSPKLRAVLVKHDLEERSIAEIAAELRILPKTAYARLNLAREEVLRRGKALAAAGLLPAKPIPPNDLLEFRETVLTFGLYVPCSSFFDPELEAILDAEILEESMMPDPIDDLAFLMEIAS